MSVAIFIPTLPTEDCAEFGASEKKIEQLHQYTSSFSWKYETGTVITFLFIQMDHGMEMLWHVLVFPSDTLISMRLPDSASVFTAEVWAIIKALEQIKDSIASKYIVYTDSLPCLQALHHMKLEHPLIWMVIRKCLFKFCQKNTFFLVGYPAILALRASPGR